MQVFLFDLLPFDRHFDELGEADDDESRWADVSVGPVPDREVSHVTARQLEQYNYPRTPEEWQEHLRLWREWQGDPENPLHGLADLDRIALIGHSRGGEAVATAALTRPEASSP